ncbi:MAG: hypothetical protein AB7O39_06435 [Flavobacteriaceae bacterium]
MDELVSRIASQVGVDENTARRAVEIILGFLKDAGPEDEVSTLLDEMPGGRQAAEAGSGEAGFMGAMGAFNALTRAGLGMGEVQGVVKEVVAYAREKAGAERVDAVIGAIPGLSQFV